MTETLGIGCGKQTLNDQWWAGWAIPDEWDRVALIPVPR